MSQVTQNVTNNTINFIQQQIAKKNTPIPYYADKNLVKSSITDMDVFPYHRFYRGIACDPNPNVMEREAGYRTRYQAGYTPDIKISQGVKPNVCFNTGCSTIYPCLGNSEKNILKQQQNETINKQLGNNLTI